MIGQVMAHSFYRFLGLIVFLIVAGLLPKAGLKDFILSPLPCPPAPEEPQIGIKDLRTHTKKNHIHNQVALHTLHIQCYHYGNHKNLEQE